MKHVEVPLKLDAVMPKDLKENQELCPHCHGTGLIIGKHSLSVCHHCNKGVITNCKHCGKPLSVYGYCQCEGAEKEREEQEILRRGEEAEKLYDSAINKLTPERAVDIFDMLYVYETDVYVYTDDFESIREALQNNYHVFGTLLEHLALDAISIVERACEEMHEGAFDDVYDNVYELQRALDKWVEEYGGGASTYYPDFYYTIELTDNEVHRFSKGRK